ncbi:MAG: flagellar hook-associated protein FlgK [Deltaproteobacteria bacterium]|nr:flagellar hook-associated protein FlgK [Deltaproteobacteria bacterium]
MAVNDILELGRQGLTSNRQALQTTSGNIANANTPGYTRRRAIVETNNLSIPQGANMGSGVEVKRVIRVHDQFVNKQIIDESQNFGGTKAKAENLQRIELVTQRDADNVNNLVNKFFGDLREMSLSPETTAIRNVVQSSGQALASGMKSMSADLEGMKQDLDYRIEDTVAQVNGLTRELAELNRNIMQGSTRKDTVLDLEDRRDSVMRELSQKINFQTHIDDLGQISVVTGGCILVQGERSNALFAVRTAAEGEKGPGSLDLFIKNHGEGRKISGGITDGELGGMMHVRDKVLNPAIEHLDKIAYHIATEVNSAHQEGEGMDGVSGREFFKDIGSNAQGAAYRFDLHDDIKSNFENIAVGYSGSKSGSNEVALKMANIQNEKGLLTNHLGTQEQHTINESLNALVARVGVETQREGNLFNHQKDVVQQLENYRQSVEGVNLEEEAVNMIQFQTVFNASAKAMKVGEELFDTILSLKN